MTETFSCRVSCYRARKGMHVSNEKQISGSIAMKMAVTSKDASITTPGKSQKLAGSCQTRSIEMLCSLKVRKTVHCGILLCWNFC